MFRSIELRNFQRHGHRKVSLSRFVTTLVGRSDVGKSAILRALRWLCFNYPSGDQFIRKGANTAGVRVVLDDETRIIRKKGKGTNSYHLDGGKFVAFGNRVPQPIVESLCVAPLNFQSQLDPPFWLSLSPGQLSKEINKIVDLGVIDDSFAYVQSGLRKAKTTVEVCEERLTQAKTQVSELDWVDQANNELVELEALEDKMQKVAKEKASLRDNITKIIQCRKKGKRLSGKRRELKELVQAANDVMETEKEEQGLKGIITRLERTAKESEELWSRQQEIRKRLATVKKCPVCGKVMNT